MPPSSSAPRSQLLLCQRRSGTSYKRLRVATGLRPGRPAAQANVEETALNEAVLGALPPKRSIQQIQLRRNALLLGKLTAQGDSVRCEDPEWISEMCQSLEFRLKLLCRFKRPGHIHVNEAQVFKSWVKESVSSRAVALLDSRVTMGAVSKGRSSSFASSRILRGTPGYILGSGLYPGLLHCYSADNRADRRANSAQADRPTDPSSATLARGASVGPTKRAVMQLSVQE